MIPAKAPVGAILAETYIGRIESVPLKDDVFAVALREFEIKGGAKDVVDKLTATQRVDVQTCAVLAAGHIRNELTILGEKTECLRNKERNRSFDDQIRHAYVSGGQRGDIGEGWRTKRPSQRVRQRENAAV